jgi:hypothetical protein
MEAEQDETEGAGWVSVRQRSQPVKAYQVKDRPVSIHTPVMQRWVNVGDWIIVTENGETWAQFDRNFAAIYDIIPE